MKQNNEAKELIKYLKSLGIQVYTNTKARGHQGFFLKNRIDISKNVSDERLIPTLLHEFAHYIHAKIEPDMPKTGGELKVLFALEKEETEVYKKELLALTNFVDKNSLCERLFLHREQLKNKIKSYEKEIKKEYPNFMRSKKFKDFDKYIKKSKAKYLLKYDRVQFVSPFLRRKEVFSLNTLEADFPDMKPAFCAYLRMKSTQRKQARNSRRINYYKKYYSKPTELFARFIEGLYINESISQTLAPLCCEKFYALLAKPQYSQLKTALEIVNKTESQALVYST